MGNFEYARTFYNDKWIHFFIKENVYSKNYPEKMNNVLLISNSPGSPRRNF